MFLPGVEFATSTMFLKLIVLFAVIPFLTWSKLTMFHNEILLVLEETLTYNTPV